MTVTTDLSNAYLFCSIPHVSLVETAAVEGFKGVVVDDEKFHANPETIQHLFLASEKWRIEALMRLRIGTQERVEYALSLGARCVLLPRLVSPDQVRQLVSATLEPPRGIRGLGSSRATLFPVPGDAPPDPTVQVIVETPEMLEKVAEVATIDGVSGLDIGVLDLAAALGTHRSLTDPRLRDAILSVIAAARENGKTVCMSAPDLKTGHEWLELGLTGFILEPLSLMRQSLKGA